jgi:hypothetical protein
MLMATSLSNELQEFHRFVAEKLANGGAGLSPEEVVGEWRILHPNADELTESAAVLRQAIAEADRGEYLPADRVIADTRQKLNLPSIAADE